jgi:FKBP-type peptidyl-prolyl cis-trans isomerase
MKQIFFGICVSVLGSMAVNAQAKPKAPAAKSAKPAKVAADTSKPKAISTLKNSTDSFSYALGVNVANNLKQQGIEVVNNAAMAKGMNDVFKKKAIELNEQQCNGVIQQKLQANQAKKSNGEKAKSQAFLASNKKRPGVITLPDGLQYEILKKGDASSAMPRLQDTVVAHYAGTLIDGKKFDNSYDRGQPLTIPVSGVIKGWTEILQLMHIGDKYKIFVPSELGYGERGAGADIPGGATLIFEMELLEIKPAGTVTEMPKEDKKN